MKNGLRTLSLCLMFTIAPAVQNPAQPQEQTQLTKEEAKTLIVDTVKNLSVELTNESKRLALNVFVLELHTARTELKFWGYETNPKFQKAFAEGYRAFLTALEKGAFPTKLANADLNLMLNGYSMNADRFYSFLGEARGQVPEYKFLSLDNKEIIKGQVEFSALVYAGNFDLWKSLTSAWSIFVPISEGP